MATITVQSLINKAQTILQDIDGVRWPTSEMLDWLDAGQLEIVRIQPVAHTVNQSMALVPGTRQTLPPGGIHFVEAVRNIDGQAVREVLRGVLDAQIPNWHNAPASNVIVHFMLNPSDPLHFYVYPPANTGAALDVVYSTAPAPIARTGTYPNELPDAITTINLEDVYASALLDYLLYRAYSKDAEYAGNAQLAVAYFTAFSNSLGTSGAAAA